MLGTRTLNSLTWGYFRTNSGAAASLEMLGVPATLPLAPVGGLACGRPPRLPPPLPATHRACRLRAGGQLAGAVGRGRTPSLPPGGLCTWASACLPPPTGISLPHQAALGFRNPLPSTVLCYLQLLLVCPGSALPMVPRHFEEAVTLGPGCPAKLTHGGAWGCRVRRASWQGWPLAPGSGSLDVRGRHSLRGGALGA